MRQIVVFTAVVLAFSCGQRSYYAEPVKNPDFKQNTAFGFFEDLNDPKFAAMRTKYQLDTVFHGEKDELKRILLLRDWIKRTMPVKDFGDPYPGDGYAERILDAALANGQGYHCGHFMVVQNAVMNAYGYVTRCVGSGPGVKGADGHHGINEIWLNDQHKWFLSDAKYNHHFEKNGVPLSALEIRDEFIKNKAADIKLVKGPDRTVIESDGVADINNHFVKVDRAGFAQWYTWLEWDKNNNRYTTWPDFNGDLNMYRDEYFKNNTWLWDGKPHWGLNSEHVKYVESRDAIEWTPNTIQSAVVIKGDVAQIHLTSATPNFREYQVKGLTDGEWKPCDSSLTVKLEKKNYDLSFRAVNLANIYGPENKVIIDSK